jgi:CheY-like chemotaxis protein
VRAFASRVLAAQGYTVLEAPEAEAALALAATHPGPIELLVTDVVMPGLSGRELAERLVVDRPATRVLYMSGYAEDHFGRSGALAEAIAYLAKPFTANALAHAVRDALERPFGEGRAG